MPGIMKYINRISRANAIVYSNQLKDYGITQIQHPYILLICREPGISQERIAKEICVNRSNVTRQLTILEEKKLITRMQDAQDRRIWRVYPTEAMQELLPTVRRVMREWNEYLLKDLTDGEREQLVQLLGKITVRANQAAENHLRGKE